MEIRDLADPTLEPLVPEGQREEPAQREIDATHLGGEPLLPGVALQDEDIPGRLGRGLGADVELHSRSFRRRSASSAKARRTMDSTPSVTSSPPSASGSHHWTASASEPASARPAVGVAR